MTVFGWLQPAREHNPVFTSLAPGTVNLGVPASTGAVVAVGAVAGGGALAGAACVGVVVLDAGAVDAAAGAAGCAAAVSVPSEPVPAAEGLAVADRCLCAWQYQKCPPFLRLAVMLEHPGALHLFPVCASAPAVGVAELAPMDPLPALSFGNGVRSLAVVHPRKSQWSQCSRISLRIMRMSVPAVVRHS